MMVDEKQSWYTLNDGLSCRLMNQNLNQKEKMGETHHFPSSNKVLFHLFLAPPALETATLDGRTSETPSTRVTGAF